MITGFNTDVEYDGVVYHVQTEDKGIETPLILSLVYVDGAIIGSKRTPYDDLIASGFDETVLAKRLQRQHKLICAAVRAGRIEELKRMSEADSRRKTLEQEKPRDSHQGPAAEDAQEPKPPTITITLCAACGADVAADDRFCGNCGSAQPGRTPFADDAGVDLEGGIDNVNQTVRADEPAVMNAVHSDRPVLEPSPAKESGREATRAASHRFSISETKEDEALRVSLLEEPTLRSGASATLRVRVTRAVSDEREPVAEARVTLTILGTTFRPRSVLSLTDKDGVALISAQLPQFTGGRAAILIRAEIDAETTELRRVILPA